jgi:hypothetical protein
MFEGSHFNIVLTSIIRVGETGEFFNLYFTDRSVFYFDSIFPEAVTAKTLRSLFLQRREGVLGTSYKVCLADRSCRRQSHLSNPSAHALATSKILGIMFQCTFSCLLCLV